MQWHAVHDCRIVSIYALAVVTFLQSENFASFCAQRYTMVLQKHRHTSQILNRILLKVKRLFTLRGVFGLFSATLWQPLGYLCHTLHYMKLRLNKLWPALYAF